MKYIEGILQPGERLVYSSKIHSIIYLPAVGILLLALAALTRASGNPDGGPWLMIADVLAVVGVIWFAAAWFKRWTTEIDVTNRRIVYKRGFIKRHTVEMNMDKVESVDVDQSIFGRLLNYGDITIRGTGIGLEPLHRIDAPLEFRNHVTAR
jgi:uncharacterized membrane protein YdbT with pleckstrin-like domain